MTEIKATRPEPPKRAKKSRPMAGVIWGGLFLVGVLVGWFARDFMAVNACLDAGGAWTMPGVCVGAPPR